jgi:hypothetical protein
MINDGFKSEINNIRNALVETDTDDLFGSEDCFVLLAEACKNYLLSLGYKVADPVEYKYKNINNQDDLIKLFYGLLARHHPDQIISGRNIMRDRRIAKSFVNSRLSLGTISKKTALNECAEIIGAVFEYEKEFNFKLSIRFDMFGQDKCKWITDKAIEIICKKKKAQNKDKHDKMVKQADDMLDEQVDVCTDLDEILKKFDEEN